MTRSTGPAKRPPAPNGVYILKADRSTNSPITPQMGVLKEKKTSGPLPRSDGPTLSLGIDWLEITGLSDLPPELHPGHLEPVLGPFRPASNRQYRTGIASNFCTFLEGPRWRHLSPWRITFPGKFWQAPPFDPLKHFPWSHVTRLDYRADFVAYDFPVTHTYHIQPARGRPLPLTAFYTDDTYSGFRAGKGDFVYRLYDKAREQNRPDLSFWWRWEAVIRGEPARQAILPTFTTPNIDAFGSALLSGLYHRFLDSETGTLAWFCPGRDATRHATRHRAPFDLPHWIESQIIKVSKSLDFRLKQHAINMKLPTEQLERIFDKC